MSNDRSLGARRLSGLVVGLAVMLAVAVVPATAAADAQPVHAGVDYLALGDSVAFGYRPPAVTPPADYLDASNFVGYPEDLAAGIPLMLSNASCPGETTASMITAGAQSNGCENSVGSPVGYRTLFPLHVDYSGTQLSYAVSYLRSHPRTRLVTLDIGANVLSYAMRPPPITAPARTSPPSCDRSPTTSPRYSRRCGTRRTISTTWC